MTQFSGDNKYLFLILFLTGVFFVFVNKALAQKTLAFPGASGFGKYSLGGRGGEVIKVKNLEDSGPGSLRAALEAEGPRIVVFETGGLIDLETPIYITNPYITIVGQTAPGDGIAIRGNSIKVRTNNVIIRFLRVRPGDRNFGPENQWNAIDAITVGTGNIDSKVFNVIVDHCSFSWAVDEVVSITGNANNITIQNSIIAEGLNDSKHPERHHSKGLLVRDGADKISLLNNLLLHNNNRNPKMNTSGLVDVRNNVIYNPGVFATTLVNTRREAQQQVNLVNNEYVPGPSTRLTQEISIYKPDLYNGKIFMDGNTSGNKPSKNDWTMLVNKNTGEQITEYEAFQSEEEFPNFEAERKSKSEIERFLNDKIGASLPIRDKVDERLIEEFNTKRGSIIDSQDEVGGWPAHLNALPPEDKQDNGIPDSWMDRYGVQPGEENRDFDNDGYTNIEEYLNGTDPTDADNEKEDIFRTSALMESFQQFDFQVEQNYPNPFRTETIIRVKLPNGNAQIYVYDSIGRKIKKILDRDISMGEYELIWEPDRNLSSGTYFLRVIHEGKAQNLPMTYIK